MKKFGFATVVASGLAAAVLGLAGPAQADIGHHDWVHDIQQQATVGSVTPTFVNQTHPCMGLPPGGRPFYACAAPTPGALASHPQMQRAMPPPGPVGLLSLPLALALPAAPPCAAPPRLIKFILAVAPD
jgi:hypothetical protein